MKRSFFQFVFGIKVFFHRLSVKNYFKIIRFLWLRFILRKPVPFSAVFSLTYKCQCSCVHCSVRDYRRQAEDLSTQGVRSIIDALDRLGGVKITFFGGEPLLRKDIAEIVRYASDKGIRASIDTNGVLLDEALVIELKRAGIGNINVSIDSATQEIHDALRRSKGCFSSAVRGLESCVKHKIPCLVSTYASRRSIATKDLGEIVKLAKKVGASGVKILFPILSGEWRESEAERLSPQEEAYVKSLLDPSFVYIEDALEMVTTRGKQCSALQHNLIYISPYGDLQPCPAIPIAFGNLLHENIEDIVEKMNRSPLFKKHKSCHNCLMNDPGFRDSFFASRANKELPLHVEEFKF